MQVRVGEGWASSTILYRHRSPPREGWRDGGREGGRSDASEGSGRMGIQHYLG